MLNGDTVQTPDRITALLPETLSFFCQPVTIYDQELKSLGCSSWQDYRRKSNHDQRRWFLSKEAACLYLEYGTGCSMLSKVGGFLRWSDPTPNSGCKNVADTWKMTSNKPSNQVISCLGGRRRSLKEAFHLRSHRCSKWIQVWDNILDNNSNTF